MRAKEETAAVMKRKIILGAAIGLLVVTAIVGVIVVSVGTSGIFPAVYTVAAAATLSPWWVSGLSLTVIVIGICTVCEAILLVFRFKSEGIATNYIKNGHYNIAQGVTSIIDYEFSAWTDSSG